MRLTHAVPPFTNARGEFDRVTLAQTAIAALLVAIVVCLL